MHMNIGVAIDKSKFEGQNLDDVVINILCERIPDLFDYISDDTMVTYTVSQVKNNEEIIKSLYGYFDPFQAYCTDFSPRAIYNGFLDNLDDDDLVYVVDCHI